jgi:hypothetical protein
MKVARIYLLFIAMVSALLPSNVLRAAELAPGARPTVVPAVRHDVSPALSNIPVIPGEKSPLSREVLRQPLPKRGPKTPGFQDPVLQNFHGISNMPAPANNFGGGDNTDGVLPPDTNGDVGPNHYVQWVNLHFTIYNKSGVKVYGPAAGNTLWTKFGGPCENTNDGDPIALYDHLANRWLMSQFAFPNFPFGPYYQCVAISTTSDPTGQYYRYQFTISDSKLNDYPKFGVWSDGYYMSFNQFSCDIICQIFGFASFDWAGQGVAVFQRDKMLNGQPANMVSFDLFGIDPNLGGMLPSDLDGQAPPSGRPNHFVQIDDDASGYSPDQLQIWQFKVDWSNTANSTFTKKAALPVAAFDSNLCGFNPCIPQPGGAAPLDALSDRLMYRLQYRNFGDHESLAVNHTVDVGLDHAGIRWYEIRDPNGAPNIYQQGTYAPDADHRWMGSVAMDKDGNMALGFSVSSAATYPSIRYVGRLAGDTLGTLPQGETVIVAGSGSQTHDSGRWGDYSMMAVDPTDDCTFWYTQEYYDTTSVAGWKTRIASFKFLTCGGGGSSLPTVTIAATTPNASETNSTAGVFTVSRSGGDISSSLPVNYTVGGTASNGIDYQTIPVSITISAGSPTANISVTPIDDAVVEANETVVLTLVSDPTYTVGSPNSASVTITDNDAPPASIAITSPKGGETWRIKNNKTITWTSSGVTGNVNIYLSRNNGNTYAVIIGNTANDRTQNWKVTGPATGTARVKVCSVSATVCGTSNNFTIK